METPKEYYYTYYSYEEWERGYIGSRGCKCPPEEDTKYFGSSKDKTFKPTQKIILKDNYATREEAYADEIILQEYYKVVENPHFANRAYQTSTKFYVPREQSIENGRKGALKTKGENNGMYGKKRPDLAERNRKGKGRKIKYSENGLKLKQKSISLVNSQKWECCITGYVSTAAGVVAYQKGKRISPSKTNRRKIT